MNSADLVITNGTVYTMRADNHIAEAIAVKDGRIMFVGTEEAAARYITEATQIMDLEGKTVLPGFVETHVHVPGNAYNALHNINLFDAHTEVETMQMIEDFIKRHPSKTRYYGRGFKNAVFPGMEGVKGPRKERLDKICPHKPVIIIDEGGHVSWLNSKALDEDGITKDTPEVAGGVIEKCPHTGELWGTLKDEARCLYTQQKFSIEEKAEAYQWFQDLFVSYGYTTIVAMRQSASPDPTPILSTMAEFERRGDLKFRVFGAREIKVGEDAGRQLEALRQLKQEHEKNHGKIKVTMTKFFLDGTVEAGNAFLSEPYGSAAGRGEGYCGELIWERQRLQAAFTEVLENGFNIHIHAVGDEAAAEAINALEAAQNSVPGDHRNCITHLQLVKPADIVRMGELDIIACVNAYWHLKDPQIYFGGEVALLGKERAENAYPLESFIKADCKVVCSADYPVTPDPNPFFAIQAGVTRNLYHAASFGEKEISDMDDPKWLLGPGERAGVIDMVKAYTINGAYALHMEEELGSIEVGKRADLVVIDKDIFHVNPLEIQYTKVLKTMLGGKVTYDGLRK